MINREILKAARGKKDSGGQKTKGKGHVDFAVSSYASGDNRMGIFVIKENDSLEISEKHSSKVKAREFLGGPVVMTRFCCGPSSVLGWATNILQTTWCGQ